MQIKTNKVKEIVIKSSNFTHLPLPGLEIRNADKLSISDSYFHRISAGSVTVKSAKEVEVINNQFSINAIQVVKSNEGSRLYISCNRLEYTSHGITHRSRKYFTLNISESLESHRARSV